MVIDFHVHTFPAKISLRALESMSQNSRTVYFTDGTTDQLQQSMQRCGVDYSVNLPVMTNPGQVEKVNSSMIRDRETLAARGIIAFGGMHPDYENYKAELRRLRENGIKGIKIHPAYQNTDLNDIRFKRIIDAASNEGLIITTHAGVDIGLYAHDYATPQMSLEVIRDVSPEKFVLAHMGGWCKWDEVGELLAGLPVYFDTAFSLGDLVVRSDEGRPPYADTNLSNDRFRELVRAHGAERILFATDSPWERQDVYQQRLKDSGLTPDECNAILGGNAIRLLALEAE